MAYTGSMDPITHTLAGVGMANAWFRRRARAEGGPQGPGSIVQSRCIQMTRE